MSSLTQLFTLVTKALTFFSVGRIVKLVVLLVIAALAISFWDNRPVIYNEINSTIGKISMVEIPTPSEKTKQSIRNVVNHDATIVAAQLVNFSLMSNTKKPIFFYSDSTELQAAMDNYQLTKIAESELLIRGDTDNNERIARIANSDFVCVPVPERMMKAVPTTKKYAKAICSISVPPFQNGKIAGYINLWIDHMPDPGEVTDYRSIARAMAMDVWERDISPPHY